MSARSCWLLAWALFVAPACQNKETPADATPSPEAPASAASPPPPSPPAAPPPVDLSQVEAPTEAEFETEAEQSISAKNLDQELDKLEKEIEASP